MSVDDTRLCEATKSFQFLCIASTDHKLQSGAKSVECEYKQLFNILLGKTTVGDNMSALCVGEDFLSY